MSKYRALVVDDDPEIRNGYSKIIRDLGVPVSSTDDWEKVKSELGVGDVAVVFLDLYMGELMGTDLIEDMRKLDNTVTIVMVTGNPDVGSSVKSLKMGAADYLVKPVSKDTIIQATVRGIQNKRNYKEIEFLETKNMEFQTKINEISNNVTRNDEFANSLLSDLVKQKIELSSRLTSKLKSLNAVVSGIKDG